MIFLKNILKKKILNKHVAFLFTLTICLSFNIKADAYYDDSGNEFRLLFENTPIGEKIPRDFAITYNSTDDLGNVVAKVNTYYGDTTNRIRYNTFLQSKKINMVIFEFGEEMKAKGYLYYVIVFPDYHMEWNDTINSTSAYMFTERSLSYTGITNKPYTIKNTYYSKSTKKVIYGFDTSGKTMNTNGKALDRPQDGFMLLLIKENEINNLFYPLQDTELNSHINSNGDLFNNLIYSTVNIYDAETGELLYSPEEQRDKVISNYSIACDDDDPYKFYINFTIENIMKYDKLKLYKDNELILEKNYDSDMMKESDKLSFIEQVDGVNGLYKIEIYDKNNKLIHTNEFDINEKIIQGENIDDVNTELKKNTDDIYEKFGFILDFIDNIWNGVDTKIKTVMFGIFCCMLLRIVLRIIL